MKSTLFRISKFCTFRISIFILIALTMLFPGIEQAFSQSSQSGSASVRAQVGQYHLSFTGYHSPNASIIVKTSAGTFLTSTTTDSQGYFSASNILVNTSETKYCFQAVDFRRIGLSESCYTLPEPVTEDALYENIFLPPSIALSKKQINQGENAEMFGYSMPGAKVNLAIGSTNQTVDTDEPGFYTYTYEDAAAGTFQIKSTATLNNEKSLDPTNEVILEVLSIPAQITNILDDIPKPSSSSWLWLSLLALALLTAIGVLLYKLRFKIWVIVVDFLRRRKKMHHDWFLDKW